MSPDQILDRFNELAPWTRFDEWTGIWVEATGQSVCVLFGEDQEADFKVLILRGADPASRFLQYRSGDWIPEFGLDFATTDGIRVNIVEDQVESYLSCYPGLPPEPLRLDEKQFLFEVLDGINYLVEQLDRDALPALGESEDYCYHLWKVAKTWRAEVEEFPEEQFLRFEPVQAGDSRVKRILGATLPRDGVWEAAPFFLPATRFQGNQEVFVQCAAVAERGAGLLGLVTLEAHASPEQEIAEAILGSIEQQKRIPQFLVVKDERLAERLLEFVQKLGIQLRIRRRLKDLEEIREGMIEDFPDEDEDGGEA
ncbi:hypothetical protein EB061_00090 [bacterium]|jgi:hypothetical protein|nr:hypothetical protein [bacterium]